MTKSNSTTSAAVIEERGGGETETTMGRVKLDGFECERCGHRWYSRMIEEGSDELPTICPGCKSPYWNKPRSREKRKGATKK
jgi:predicted Zn-ribbon and HTH transcriptional regulator